MRIINDRVLIKIIKQDTTKSGLYIPKKSQKNNTGIVVLVGDKVKFTKVGDTIMRYDHAGIPLNYLGEDCLLLSEGRDIISILLKN